MPEELDVIEFSVPEGKAPQRLDQYIGHNPELHLTRSKAQKLIEQGLVTVNGKVALHHQILKEGDKVVVNLPPPPKTEIAPEDIPLEIVYEDEFLLAVNKPAGMVTHPAAGNYQGTLVNALLHYSKQLSKVQGFDRPGIVHRLDRDTSGLILVAKNDEVHVHLQNALRDRKIKKTYRALICGHMKSDSGKIELPVGRSIRDRKKMTVTRVKGREAVTEYRLLDRFKLYDLLEINLPTGRTHQIRVHFSHLGHPVFGDAEYGGRLKWHRGIFSIDKRVAQKALDLMPRQALHAKSLEFVHPVTNETVKLDTELPTDFRGLLEFLEREGR